MKNATVSVFRISISFAILLAIVFAFQNCKLIKQISGSSKKQINFCGEFRHGDQPASYCACTSDSTLNESGQFVKTPNYKWFDRFGNRYCNLYMKDPCAQSEANKRSIVPGVNFSAPNEQSAGGLFNLYFSDIQNNLGTGFDHPSNATPFIEVITQVFSDIDAMLATPATSCNNPFVPVNIEIQSINNSGSGVLGEASSYYEYLGETSGIKHNEIWKAINSGANDPALWDGYIRINLGYSNWYTGYNGSGIPAGQVDLYTVVLHEVLHAMGFASLIAQDGGSKLQLTSNNPVLSNYSVFDQFLQFENGLAITEVITNTGGYNWSYNTNSNPVSDLRSGCQNPTPTGPDIRFSGANNTPGSLVHAPASWSNGSSLSHFQINCDNSTTPEFVMNASISTGTWRRITLEETKTLCDLGYALTGTYGTTLLDVGGANPNTQAVQSCGQLLVAVDDNGPCCQNTNFTVQYCPNTTLTIHTSDLICNDVFIGSVTVVDFEVIATGTTVPQSGTDFIYTPSLLGQNILRYRLQDNLGNKSNYAYVIIDVTVCSDFSCNSTSICNMICNSDMVDIDINCDPLSGANGLSGGCLEGWGYIFGTPDFSSSPPYTSFMENLQNIPGSMGGKVHLLGLHIYNVNGPGDEGIRTSVNVLQNKKYIVSVHALKRFKDNVTWGLSAGIAVSLINQSDITWALTSAKPLFPLTQQTIEIQQTSVISAWQQFVSCFNADYDFDRLFVMGVGNSTQPNGSGTTGYTFVDLVEFIEDKIEQIQTVYSIQCGQTITIGDNLCAITNMNYSWYDVTNSSIGIPLTNGTTVLASGVSIPSGNANGSQIQVSPNQNKVYELRRRMISTNGIPIAMNNCDKDVQVNVNVNTNLTIQKIAVSGSTALPGSTVQFQIAVTNSTGSALNNVAIHDVLDPDFLAGTLVFSTNPNIIPSVTNNNIEFTVTSLPDGATETFNYSVQLNPATTQTTITNCAKVEYSGCFQEDCVDITIGGCACPGWPQFIPTIDATGSKIRVGSNGDVYSTSGGGNFTFTNCSNNFSVNGNGILAKYNSCGKLIWIESLPKAGMEISLYEVSGNTFVYVTGLNFVAKFADNGTSASQLWWYDMSNPATVITALATDNQGNAYVAGNLQTNTVIQHNGAALNLNVPNGAGIFLLKYDLNGTITWNEVIKNTVVTVSPCNYTTIKIKGMAVNSNGDKIFITGDGMNAKLEFGLGSTCPPLIIPALSAPSCIRSDIFTAVFEQNANVYNCNWAERISGDGSNLAFDIACENASNNFYFTGWATDNSTSSSGFLMPPTGNSQTRGHFLAKYTYNGTAGVFNSIYRDGNLQTNYVTGHINDLFFDNVGGNTIFLTKRTTNGEPFILKHSASSIISSLWSSPIPVVPLTNGHANSVATNGLLNANNNREVFFTGFCTAGVVFDVSSNSGTVQVTYPQGGIFIAKIEDQSSGGILKQ